MPLISRDPILHERLVAKIDAKTKPLGSLGRLESLAVQIGCVFGSESPDISRCRLTLFAGDHGFAVHGVSAYPQEVTRQMLLNFLGGGAASTVIARQFGVDVLVVDAGVVGDRVHDENLRDHRIANGTADATVGPAMTQKEFTDAFETGRRIGGEPGHDVACFGEMGIGNTASASLVIAKILEIDVEELVGRGTGLDDAGLDKKRKILSQAARRTQHLLDPEDALREYGGFEVVMLVGAYIGAAETGKLVVIDGFIAGAASLAAVRLHPEIRDAFVYSHQSSEQGHVRLLEALDARPLLDLEMRLGEGTGALMAWPLIQASIAVLNDMASFESANVSQKI